jgi:hypothetical protein
MLSPLGIGGKGDHIKIPLPYGYNVAKVMGAEMGRAMLLGADPGEAAMNVMSSAIAAFNPVGGQDALAALMPTVLDAPLEIARNENVFGSSIAPDYPNDRRPPSERFFPGVNPFLRWLTAEANEATGGNTFRAGWVSVSPEYVEHIFEAFTGGLGRLVTRTADTAPALFSDAPADLERVPFLRQFYGETWGEMPTVRAYRTLADRAEALGYEIDGFRKAGDRDGMKAARERDPALTGFLSQVERAQKRLRELRAQERKIAGSPRDEEDKAARLETIRSRQHQIRRDLLDLWNARRADRAA